MNKIKLIAAFIAMLSFSEVAFSQDISQASESVKKIAAMNVKKWQNKLILNTGQSSKLLESVTKYEMKKSAIFKSDTSMEEKNKELKDLEKAHDENVGTFLSEKQFEKYHKAIAEIKGKHK